MLLFNNDLDLGHDINMDYHELCNVVKNVLGDEQCDCDDKWLINGV